MNKHYKFMQIKFTKIQFVNLKGEFCPLKSLSGKQEFGRLRVSYMLVYKWNVNGTVNVILSTPPPFNKRCMPGTLYTVI